MYTLINRKKVFLILINVLNDLLDKLKDAKLYSQIM